MNIEQFMRGYKAAWEQWDDALLPRMVLDGLLRAEFEGDACKKRQIRWHSMPQRS